MWWASHPLKTFGPCDARHRVWRPSHFVVKIFFSGIFEVWRASQPVTGVTTCDGRHTPSDRRHTLITKINQSNEKYYCMTGDMPFEVFQWSMNGWIEWTWDWRLAELFRLQVIFFYSFENNTTSYYTINIG